MSGEMDESTNMKEEKKNDFKGNIKQLIEEIANILIEKNKKYGNSFYEGLDEIKELYKQQKELNEIKKLYKPYTKENSLFNYVHYLSFYVREKDKLNRLKYLISSNTPEEIKKSNIHDAVLDIIGYGILFLNYLKNEE